MLLDSIDRNLNVLIISQDGWTNLLARMPFLIVLTSTKHLVLVCQRLVAIRNIAKLWRGGKIELKPAAIAFQLLFLARAKVDGSMKSVCFLI